MYMHFKINTFDQCFADVESNYITIIFGVFILHVTLQTCGNSKKYSWYQETFKSYPNLN